MHRIGQKKSVKIYRLITAKTYEQHMFHRASLKLGLEVAVMDQMRLRKGEDTALMEGKKKASADKLSPEDVRFRLLNGHIHCRAPALLHAAVCVPVCVAFSCDVVVLDAP